MRSPGVGPYDPPFAPGMLTGFSCPHGEDPAGDARRHIEERRPHLVGFGLVRGRACVALDVGLPFESFGCVLTGDGQRYADAYNSVVLEALRAGRLEEFRVKAREISPEQVRALFAEGGGIRLGPGSPPLLAPGGRFEVAFQPWPSEDDSPKVWIVDRRTRQRREPIEFGNLPAVVAFDPEGQALVRHEDHEFTSWDLATGLPFDEFYDGFMPK